MVIPSHFASHFAANATGTLRNDTNDLLGGAGRLEPVCDAADDAGRSYCASRQLPRAQIFRAVASRHQNSLSGAQKFTVGFPIQNAPKPQKSNRNPPVDFHERLATIQLISELVVIPNVPLLLIAQRRPQRLS